MESVYYKYLLCPLHILHIPQQATKFKYIKMDSLWVSISSFLDHLLDDWSGILLALFLCLLYYSFLAFKRINSQPVPHWPIIGALPSLMRHGHRFPEWMVEIFQSLGNVGSVYAKCPIFPNINYLVTCDPQNTEYVLKTNFNNYPKGPEFKEVFDIHGDGLLTAVPEWWRFQRRLAHKCFTSMDYRGVVAASSHKVVDNELVPFLTHLAEQGSVVDFQDVCIRYAFDCSTATIFGKDVGHLAVGLPGNELSEAIEDIHEAIVFRHVCPSFFWKLMRFLNVGVEKKYAKGWKKIDEVFADYISQKKESLAKGVEPKTADLLSVYIRNLEESKEENVHIKRARTSEDFLRDALLGTFVAAKDATGSGLTWFFWLVAQTPRVEEKIIEELKELAMKDNKENDEHGGKTTWPVVFDPNDLNGLVYLHAALMESLRMYPPVPTNRKGVAEDDILPDGSVVKAGTQILLSVYAAGRMPWIWGEDSLEFKPERWIDDEGKLGFELTSKFFVFNVGPRSCLGRNTSFTEMKAAAAATIYNFRIHLEEGQEICSRPFVNLIMKNGLKVKISKRKI